MVWEPLSLIGEFRFPNPVNFDYAAAEEPA